MSRINDSVINWEWGIRKIDQTPERLPQKSSLLLTPMGIGGDRIAMLLERIVHLWVGSSLRQPGGVL